MLFLFAEQSGEAAEQVPAVVQWVNSWAGEWFHARQMEYTYPFWQKVLGYMGTTPENVFEISATAKVAGFSNAQNAKLAAAIVQNLIDLFVSDNLSGDRNEANQSLTFLDNEVHKREQELQQAEQRRADFEQRYLGVLPGEGSIEQRMSAARSELGNIDQQLIQAQTSMAALRSQLASTPPTIPGVGGESTGSAQSQLAGLEAQLGQYQARGWTEPGLRQALGVVAALNADVKGAAVDPDFALEAAVRRIGSARATR